MIFLAVVLLLILSFVAFLISEKGRGTKNFLKFLVTGLDTGFSLRQIALLGKVGKSAGLDDVSSLYWSLPSLDRCTAEIIRQSKLNGTENNPETQKLLSDLYKYRTSVELEQSKKKRGLESTRDINPGQRIRIVLKGAGIYVSRILRNNGTTLMIDFPSAPAGSPMQSPTSIPWLGKEITVYFWRKEDAGYEFETTVVPVPQNQKEPEHAAVLFIAHSRTLLRTQKRKSVRAKCNLYAQLYIVPSERELDTDIEPEAGMKCLLEDLSEDGAMILIGGKAVRNMKIKLQFMLHDVCVVMSGFSRGVEYNPTTHQSRIHFECGNLNPRMKNAILAFVYNVLPEEEKQQFDAIRLSEQDGQDESGTASATAESAETEELPELPDFAMQ
jgi:c-di-GMP-binding flagellar brake protein YcgR